MTRFINFDRWTIRRPGVVLQFDDNHSRFLIARHLVVAVNDRPIDSLLFPFRLIALATTKDDSTNKTSETERIQYIFQEKRFREVFRSKLTGKGEKQVDEK